LIKHAYDKRKQYKASYDLRSSTRKNILKRKGYKGKVKAALKIPCRVKL
jgi:hypothetical protein